MGNQHSLIIGGTRGIGLALARTLAEENHVLSIIGLRPPAGVNGQLAQAHYWLVDLLDQERISTALDEITKRNGKINHLVFFQRFRGQGDEWSGEIATTLTATKFVIEGVVDKFDDSGQSSIVIVSSVIGRFVAEESALSYQVAKAGLNQMMRYYAISLAPKGIRVNCVSPGTVIKEESKDFYVRNERLQNLYSKINPLGRMGTSEEVAGVIAFLCSPKASFVTGQNIIVDGGLSLQWQESLARRLFFDGS